MMIMIMTITILLLLLLIIIIIIINKYIHTEIRRRSTRCLTAKYNPFPTVETKIFSMKDWTVPKYNRSRRLANMRCTRGTTRGHALQIRKTTTLKSIIARFRYDPLWKIIISEKTNSKQEKQKKSKQNKGTLSCLGFRSSLTLTFFPSNS